MWVYTDKTPVGGPQNLKARLCVRGDQERSIAIHEGETSIKSYHDTDSPTSGREAQALYYVISASKKWKTYSADIPAAFFQGSKSMKMRDVQVNPPLGAGIGRDKVWRPLMPIYGFDDAPRHFYVSLCEEIRKRGGEPHPLDPAYFVFRKYPETVSNHSGYAKKNHSGYSKLSCSPGISKAAMTDPGSGVHIIGHLKVHVDDLEFSGEDRWIKEVWEPLREFYSIPKDEVRCAYKGSYKMTGTWVYQDVDFSVRTNQEPYISTLKEIPIKKGRPLSDPLTEQEKKKKMKLDGEMMWVGQRSLPSPFLYTLFPFLVTFARCELTYSEILVPEMLLCC
jgi:hypothetical protein